jgi:hypothetical protein
MLMTVSAMRVIGLLCQSEVGLDALMQPLLLMRSVAVAVVHPVHEVAIIDHDGVVVSEGARVAEVPAQVLLGADAICR